jgi:hypothetical protein
MWKNEEKFNHEKEIKQVSGDKVKDKAYGLQQGLAQVRNLFFD